MRGKNVSYYHDTGKVKGVKAYKSTFAECEMRDGLTQKNSISEVSSDSPISTANILHY